MKSFIHTITALIVLNLAVAGFAPAQNSQNPSQQTVSELDTAIRDEKKALMSADFGDYLNKLNIARAAQHGGPTAGTALVIPTAEIKSQDLAAIMEDMNIMSRIFDKRLGLAEVIPGLVSDSGLAVSTAFLRSRENRSTGAMYVQGYGALFMTKVDFPFSPPLQLQAGKSEEGADPVWEQTKRQIVTSGKNSEIDFFHVRNTGAREYDSEQVEKLKTKLIKALKHAANIRNLKTDESVILVVAGTRPGLIVAQQGDEPHRYRYIYDNEKGTSRPTLLTIRAKKSDIDAFSKGELDFDAFRKKVVIFTYPYLSGKAKSGRSSSSPFRISR